MALPPRGNCMPSHRIHSYCVYSPTDFHSYCVYSPTDFTDLHRWLGCVDSSGGILASAAAKCLPQISQNSQNFLLSVFSHRFHSYCVYSPTDFTDLHRCFCCIDSPTEYADLTEVFAENILPQISQICTDCLGAFKGVHLSQVHQPSKKCTNLKLAASV